MANYIESMIYDNPRPKRIKELPYIVTNPIDIAAEVFRKDKFGYVVVRAIKQKDDPGYTVKEAIRYPKYPHLPLSVYINNHLQDAKDHNLFIYEKAPVVDPLKDITTNFIPSEMSDKIIIKDVTKERLQVAETFGYILEQLD